MNALDRADAFLTNQQTRRGGVVTPNNMQSPMDASTTQQIKREVVQRIAHQGKDPNLTQRIHDDTADVTQDLSGGKKDEAAAEEPEVEEEEIDGLIPTTKTTKKSNLSARLEG